MQTLEESKKFLRENWEKGVNCPCCNQYVKRYKRKITSSMAYALILIYQYFQRNPNEEWVHIQDYLKKLDIPAPVMSGDVSKLKFWGLLEPMKGFREDGSDRVGFYRVTPAGKAFVERKSYVSKNIFLFNQQKWGESEEKCDISDCLGRAFRYDELMQMDYGTGQQQLF